MVARDLQDKLTYLGMERGIRKLALKEKMATAEEIAIMSELDVVQFSLPEVSACLYRS